MEMNSTAQLRQKREERRKEIENRKGGKAKQYMQRRESPLEPGLEQFGASVENSTGPAN